MSDSTTEPDVVWTQHLASSYANKLQRCRRCHKLLLDDRGAQWPITQGPPVGFAPGPIWEIDNMLTTDPPARGDQIEICSDPSAKPN